MSGSIAWRVADLLRTPAPIRLQMPALRNKCMLGPASIAGRQIIQSSARYVLTSHSPNGIFGWANNTNWRYVPEKMVTLSQLWKASGLGFCSATVAAVGL